MFLRNKESNFKKGKSILGCVDLKFILKKIKRTFIEYFSKAKYFHLNNPFLK
jgi:hypothetical protein